MQEGDILQFVREAVSEVCGIPISHVTASTDLIELGIDSLKIVELVAVIEKRFGAPLFPLDLFISPNIGELVTVISAKLVDSQ